MTAFLIAARLWLARLFPARAIAQAEDERLARPLLPYIARSPLLEPRPIWDGPTRKLPIVARYRDESLPTLDEIEMQRSTNYDLPDSTQEWAVFSPDLVGAP